MIEVSIILCICGLLLGLQVGRILEAWLWRSKSETPYIRMLSSGKFYNILTEDYYNALHRRSEDLTILKLETHKKNLRRIYHLDN